MVPNSFQNNKTTKRWLSILYGNLILCNNDDNFTWDNQTLDNRKRESIVKISKKSVAYYYSKFGCIRLIAYSDIFQTNVENWYQHLICQKVGYFLRHLKKKNYKINSEFFWL